MTLGELLQEAMTKHPETYTDVPDFRPDRWVYYLVYRAAVLAYEDGYNEGRAIALDDAEEKSE